MKLKIYSSDGTSCNDKEFEAIPHFEGKKGIAALKNVVVAYQAAARQGSACAKKRGEVSGSGKKPWRQKGTGMARHGSRRSPIWPKGGVVFGPHPMSYAQKINKKIRLLALKRALFDCVQEEGLDLIEKFSIQEGKTKLLNKVLASIYSAGKVLLVDTEFDENVILAGRNLERVHMVDAASINAWDLMRYNKVLFSERGFELLLFRIKA